MLIYLKKNNITSMQDVFFKYLVLNLETAATSDKYIHVAILNLTRRRGDRP